jgi:hypothetical protein
MTNRFKLGDWFAICDECGFKFHASKLRKRWDGLMVCPEDFELRHPQDFARVVPDNPTPPWIRPPPADVFVQTLCSGQARSCVVDYAVVDCAIVC